MPNIQTDYNDIFHPHKLCSYMLISYFIVIVIMDVGYFLAA